MRAHPDRFWGWVFVNPRAADPQAELERWAGEPGWIGVKAHPFWHRWPCFVLAVSLLTLEWLLRKKAGLT